MNLKQQMKLYEALPAISEVDPAISCWEDLFREDSRVDETDFSGFTTYMIGPQKDSEGFLYTGIGCLVLTGHFEYRDDQGLVCVEQDDGVEDLKSVSFARIPELLGILLPDFNPFEFCIRLAEEEGKNKLDSILLSTVNELIKASYQQKFNQQPSKSVQALHSQSVDNTMNQSPLFQQTQRIEMEEDTEITRKMEGTERSSWRVIIISKKMVNFNSELSPVNSSWKKNFSQGNLSGLYLKLKNTNVMLEKLGSQFRVVRALSHHPNPILFHGGPGGCLILDPNLYSQVRVKGQSWEDDQEKMEKLCEARKMEFELNEVDQAILDGESEPIPMWLKKVLILDVPTKNRIKGKDSKLALAISDAMVNGQECAVSDEFSVVWDEDLKVSDIKRISNVKFNSVSQADLKATGRSFKFGDKITIEGKMMVVSNSTIAGVVDFYPVLIGGQLKLSFSEGPLLKKLEPQHISSLRQGYRFGNRILQLRVSDLQRVWLDYMQDKRKILAGVGDLTQAYQAVQIAAPAQRASKERDLMTKKTELMMLYQEFSEFCRRNNLITVPLPDNVKQMLSGSDFVASDSFHVPEQEIKDDDPAANFQQRGDKNNVNTSRKHGYPVAGYPSGGQQRRPIQRVPGQNAARDRHFMENLEQSTNEIYQTPLPVATSYLNPSGAAYPDQ